MRMLYVNLVEMVIFYNLMGYASLYPKITV